MNSRVRKIVYGGFGPKIHELKFVYGGFGPKIHELKFGYGRLIFFQGVKDLSTSSPRGTLRLKLKWGGI